MYFFSRQFKEYIGISPTKFIQNINLQNKDGKYRNYRNFTTEKFKRLNSSFYLKTNGDYKDYSLVNFCLNIYNKSDQMTDKMNKNNGDFHERHMEKDF